MSELVKTYQVCDRLLDAETNEHCEYDGRVPVDIWGLWKCPSCGGTRRAATEGVDL